ncbi:MAG TPA: biotin/lipoyl-containing protein, partial [Candidatus Limnocylindrales bacterium]|nr:biotin/lipoyl-containing protein [Candidatus Limnocylindrales bacterium]
LTTNLRFLRWLVRQPAVIWGAARVDTLDTIWPPNDLEALSAIPESAWAEAARRLGGSWRLNAAPIARLATEDADQRTIPVADGPAESAIPAVRAGDTVHVDVGGRSVAFRIAAPPDVDRAARAAAAHAHAGGSAEVIAPMPGAVLAIHVGAGDSVAAGDPIATLEAMKMEHVVAASAAGRVTEIGVVVGDQVTRGQSLATVEA